MTNEEIGRLAEALGHGGFSIAPTVSGRRYQVECPCGFGKPTKNGQPTVTRATLVEAIKTGQWHLRKSVEDHLADARRAGRRSGLESLLSRS